MKTIDNKEENRYFAALFSRVCFTRQIRVLLYLSIREETGSEVAMAAQRKAPRRRISAKEREFEELLRRASIYAKNRMATNLHLVRRKRVKAA